MKIIVDKNSKEYVISHKGNVMTVGEYPLRTKADMEESSVGPNVVLEDINGYLSSMSDERQDELFDEYSAVVELLTVSNIDAEVAARVKMSFTKIMNVYYNFEDVESYMRTVDIAYPATVLEEYDSDGNRKPRETTYIRSEYFGLACVALICQGMAPLWIYYGKSLHGADRTDVLARDTTILRSLTETKFITNEHVNRLYEMIIYRIDTIDDKFKLAIKVGGNGTEAIPPYLLATILINKLSTCTISHAADKNLIVTAFTSVGYELTKCSKQHDNVRERSDTRASDGEDDKIGFLESYATRQKVSDDIHITNDIYLTNYRRFRNDLDPTIPADLVRKCYESLERNPLPAIGRHQVVLVQWICPRAIEVINGERRRLAMPRSIEHITYEGIIGAMAVVQAALIHWKFPLLARYISSTPYQVDMNDVDMMFRDVPSIISLTPDLKEMLNRTHPYMRPQGSKTASAQNVAIMSIDEYIKLIVPADIYWKLDCSSSMQKIFDMKKGMFEVDPYIKHDLAKMIALIAR